MDIVGLYGKGADSKKALERFSALEKKHVELFATMPDALFSTSGRTELGGNHTDHNHGCVIAGSINLDTIAAVHEVMDYNVTIISDGYSPINVDISDLKVNPAEFGTTQALVRGVAASIVKRGGCLGGFAANISSSVFKGSGLSSSAAIEVLIGTIFNSLFNNDRFSTTELAIMGQEAENIYFGKPSGLMDQVACANGGIVGIDFKDTSNPIITPIAIDFADYGFDYVIVNTKGSHADLTPDYAAIPSEMKAVAKFFGKDVLRDVDEADFYQNIAELRHQIKNDRAILRAYHFFREDRCVEKMLSSLASCDFKSYLALVQESGQSSFNYLQNIFSSKNACEQGISLAYAWSNMFFENNNLIHGGIYDGAFRVQGGGFAGTIETYIPQDMTSAYISHMEKLFGPDSCVRLAIRKLPTMRVK